LADLRPLCDPGTLDVVDVVQKNPGERLVRKYSATPVGCSTFNTVCCGWNVQQMKAVNPPPPVLLIADSLQMLDPFFDRFDVTEHHRGARFQTELNARPASLQPLVAVNFQRRNFLAHAIDQNFAAAAGMDPSPAFLNSAITSRSGIRNVSRNAETPAG